MIVRVLTDVYCSQSFFFFWSVFQVAAAYFAFLESLFSCHLSFVFSLDKTTFMLVVGFACRFFGVLFWFRVSVFFDVGLPYEFSFCCMHVGFVSWWIFVIFQNVQYCFFCTLLVAYGCFFVVLSWSWFKRFRTIRK